MSAFRRNPVFAAAMTVCVMLALGEGALIGWRVWTARDLQKKIQEKLNQRTEFTTKTPAPTRDNAHAIEADLARAQQSLAVMQAELKGRGAAVERLHAAKVPVTRPDAYFDLAAFVEKTRELAKKHDVDVRAEAARFGFAAHANEGPEQTHIESVFRQRQVAQYLLEALIEARPRALLGVKREAPVTKEERAKQAAAAAVIAAGGVPDAATEAPTAPEGPDFFVINPDASVRKPGFVDATAFRFVFTGQTSALRNFLNRLGTFELPVLVREVEVEPATADESVAAAEEAPPAPEAAAAGAPSIVLSVTAPEAKPVAAPKPPGRNAPAPIVTKSISKFTVTVEYIELVPPAAEPVAPPPTT